MNADLDYVGLDFCFSKMSFARETHGPRGAFLVADAAATLPFRSCAFDSVLIRDVLHHLEFEERRFVLRESLRMVRPGGTLFILEGNADNLIGKGFSLLFPHERLMRETRPAELLALVADSVNADETAVTHWMAEPSNFFRLLLHYRFGFPALAQSRAVPAGLAWLAGWARRHRTTSRWAYTVLEIKKT